MGHDAKYDGYVILSSLMYFLNCSRYVRRLLLTDDTFTGMPGYNGDPMAMSPDMYGNFNGQGMMDMTGMNGMNGMDPMHMNMNMGMDMGMGMGMDAGQGGYDGWGNQGPWNTNQDWDSYPPHMGGGHPGMTGMSSGFGANGSTGYHPHPAAGAARSGYSNIQSAHPNFGPMPHGRQFPPHPDFQQNGFQGGPGRGFFPMGQRAGRGGRGFGPHQGGRGRGYGRGFGGDGGPFRHQPPHRPPHMMGDNNRYGPGTQGPHDTQGKQALDTGTDAKAVAGVDLWPESNDHPDTATNIEMTAQASDHQQPVDASMADSAVDTGSRKASTVDMPEQQDKSSNGNRYDGEPDMEHTANGEDTHKDFRNTSTARHDRPLESGRPSPITAALNHGEQPYSGFDGRGRGFPSRGPYRGFGGRGGRGAPGPGMNGYGMVHPASRPVAQWSSRPDVPSAVLPEPKGQGVEGAPKAPKALREGLANTGPSSRGFAIMGRGSTATGGGRGDPRRSRR